jgi:triacylglycerol lipase
MLRPVLALLLLLAGCKADQPAGPGDGRVADGRADGGSGDGVVKDARVDAPPGHGPPYPIVLLHGFFGWEQIGPIDHFWKVPGALEDDGHVVAVTRADPFNSTYVRGEQIVPQIESLLAERGAAKVNLIGHSQGGLDARYVAAKLPGRVAAVVTIATPHRGFALGDVLLQKVPGSSAELVKGVLRALGRPIYGDVAADADLKAVLEFLNTDAIKAFDEAYPDQPGVTYFSIAGRSSLALAEAECASPTVPPFVAQYAEERDPLDPLMATMMLAWGGAPRLSDGFVAIAEAKHGRWLGCIPADHFDEIGQILGDSPGLGNPFDHLVFYRDLAAFLVRAGF